MEIEELIADQARLGRVVNVMLNSLLAELDAAGRCLPEVRAILDLVEPTRDALSALAADAEVLAGRVRSAFYAQPAA